MPPSKRDIREQEAYDAIEREHALAPREDGAPPRTMPATPVHARLGTAARLATAPADRAVRPSFRGDEDFEPQHMLPMERTFGDILRRSVRLEWPGPTFHLTCSVGALAQRLARAVPATHQAAS